MEIINEKNFKEKTAKGVVIVDFFANWCGPCRMMTPILEDVKEDFGEKIQIFKVDVDEDENLARSFGIMSIPTIFIYVDGQLKEKHVGLWGQEALTETINKLL